VFNPSISLVTDVTQKRSYENGYKAFGTNYIAIILVLRFRHNYIFVKNLINED
jgi:hypothetical protein